MKQLFILFMLFSCIATAQNFDNEDYIYLKRQDKISISLSKGQFDIIKQVEEVGKHLTSKKLYFANEALHFDSFTEIKNIEAYTYIPESNKRVDVDYIETKREFDNGVFYS